MKRSLLPQEEVATLIVSRDAGEEDSRMRKMMMLVAVAAWCVLGARIASAGHFEHWTDAESAERTRVARTLPRPFLEPLGPDAHVTGCAGRSSPRAALAFA